MELHQWKPNKITFMLINNNMDKKKAFKVFRSSSSGYIKKHSIREFVLKRDRLKCCKCGSVNNLQVDHIKSVYECFKQKLFFECNSLSNLQTLCRKCNILKSHG